MAVVTLEMCFIVLMLSATFIIGSDLNATIAIPLLLLVPLIYDRYLRLHLHKDKIVTRTISLWSVPTAFPSEDRDPNPIYWRLSLVVLLHYS